MFQRVIYLDLQEEGPRCVVLPDDPKARKDVVNELKMATKRLREEEDLSSDAKVKLEKAARLQREKDNAKYARHLEKLEKVKTRIIRQVRVMIGWLKITI